LLLQEDALPVPYPNTFYTFQQDHTPAGAFNSLEIKLEIRIAVEETTGKNTLSQSSDILAREP
jgi:hypothetical protein